MDTTTPGTDAADDATPDSDTDTGTAYGHQQPIHNAELTEVGPGTPMGELLRRYWQAVALSSEATSTPQTIRVLGEDLILFRDGHGDVGLLYPRCTHRGTTLLYGKVEETGIRCCYHGWQFDTEGNVIDQPVEPEGGLHKERYRQPWYPVREYHGLVFAYMGPSERKPAFPIYDELETMQHPEEFVEAHGNSLGSGSNWPVVPCNWLQHTENVLDPAHLPVLHSMISGPQFGAPIPVTAALTHPDYEFTDNGVASVSDRVNPDGVTTRSTVEVIMPAIRLVPNPRRAIGSSEAIDEPCDIFGWVTPVDDTHYRIFSLARVTEAGGIDSIRTSMNGKSWSDLTVEEHRDFPGDFEAQTGQGEITFHSEEHLATTDRGVQMLRTFYRRQMAAVAKGDDPAGVVRGADTVRSSVRASRRIVAASPAPATAWAPAGL